MLDKRLVLSKSQANMLIKKGDVKVNGDVITKAGKQVSDDDQIEISSDKIYVGRGAYKLLKAIEEFNLKLQDLTIADCGASTGGFTQVCLEQKAKKVYAIDVGHDQLHPILKENPKVINLEKINLKNPIELPEMIDLCVVDLSFISIRKVFFNFSKILKNNGQIVLLFKPQFEVGKEKLGKGGIVSTENRIEALKSFQMWLRDKKWNEIGLCDSPIEGKDGNKEYLFFIERQES